MPGPKGKKDDASLLVRVRSTEQSVWHQLLTKSQCHKCQGQKPESTMCLHKHKIGGKINAFKKYTGSG